MRKIITINIGTKIGILTAIILIIFIEFGVNFLQDKAIEEFKSNNQKKLADFAKVIAANINADEHIKALMIGDTAEYYYNNIKFYLENNKKALGLSEEIFTVFLHNDTTSCYGVKTNMENVAKQLCTFRDSSLYPIFKKSFKDNISLYSDIYSDRNGMWLSGFAPITDKNNQTVAVVEVDISFNEYSEKLAEFTSWAMYFRIIGVFVAIVVGIFLGFVFGSPLKKLSIGMKEISGQNFRRRIKISSFKQQFPDETVVLTDSFNKMAEKLDDAINQLNDALEKLNELDRSKSVFLDLIAHELRTPLTGLGFIDFLKSHNSCKPEDEEIIDSIKESYERIKSFSFSAEKYIKALNYQHKENSVCDLNSVSVEILKEYDMNTEISAANINKNIAAIPLPVNIDLQILSDIISIILDNAIKHSGNDPIVKIETGIMGNDVYFSVEDSGNGIENMNLEKIFEPYFVDNVMEHSQGSGVNLAICRVYLSKVGARITAESNGIGRGSKFTILIPKSDI